MLQARSGGCDCAGPRGAPQGLGRAFPDPRLGATTDACQWKRKVESLESQSHSNEEFLLDVPFTAEEVSGAVARLKGKKAPGPDGLMA